MIQGWEYLEVGMTGAISAAACPIAWGMQYRREGWGRAFGRAMDAKLRDWSSCRLFGVMGDFEAGGGWVDQFFKGLFWG